ncbi:MAG: murein L,D-transpeptidase family protein [Pseudomonadota bacterium]|nr:murein L,D-transpeptidase family protein [Pseudomonadota bacterium]
MNGNTRLNWLAPLALALSLGLAGCGQIATPAMKPLSPEAKALLAQKGMREDSPIFIRIFKEESELEVWKVKDDGRYHHFKTYPICNWSGALGPKIQQGDKQAPEGFYQVAAKQMNPNSAFHLSFNLGYPNAYDKSHKRTGAHLMVHGDCKSAGCYAMTDALIEEIYALAREAFEGGQEAFDVHAFPFRMTPDNMKRHARNEWMGFWKQMKQGYDHFEYARQAPKIEVCQKQYLVNVAFIERGQVDPAGTCPAFERLPVEAAPPETIIQAGGETAPRPAGLGAIAPASSSGTAQASTAPNTFGYAPAKPTFSGFAFRSNSKLGQ